MIARPASALLLVLIFLAGLAPMAQANEEFEARPGRDYLCHIAYACEPNIGCARTGGPPVVFNLLARDFGEEIGPGFAVRSLSDAGTLLFFDDIERASESLGQVRELPDKLVGVIVPERWGDWKADFRMSSVRRRLSLDGFYHSLNDHTSRLACRPDLSQEDKG